MAMVHGVPAVAKACGVIKKRVSAGVQKKLKKQAKVPGVSAGAKSKKSEAKAPRSPSSAKSTGVRFGKTGQSYEFVSEIGSPEAVLQEAMDFAANFGSIALPKDGNRDSANAFIEELVKFVSNCPFRLAGRSSKSYSVLHVCRKILLWLVERDPSAVDQLTLKCLKDCCPDQGALLRTLSDTLTATDLRNKFSVHPLMLSCWACLFHQAPKQLRGKADFISAREMKRAAMKLQGQAPANGTPNLCSVVKTALGE